MKIIIRYDLADVPDHERLGLPDKLAGKVFPVAGQTSTSYRTKNGWHVPFSCASPHHPRTRHSNKKATK